MTELSRNLLAAAREGLAPDPAVAARVRAKVAAAVAAGAASATVATPSATLAAPSARVATSSFVVKLGVALLAVGIVAVAVVATRDPQPVESPRLVVAIAVSDEPAADIALARTASVARVDTPARAASTPRAAAVRAIPDGEPASLSREVELIDRAMVQLREARPADALATIAAFVRETRGQGQMAEDAAAIEIEASCRLRHDVTEQLAAFDRRWPSSAQRERLQTACFAR